LQFVCKNSVACEKALPIPTEKARLVIKRKVRVAARLCLEATFGFSPALRDFVAQIAPLNLIKNQKIH